ncbi:MAG: PaaI family thioesterase [Thermodesulfovibrionales bacterium]|nr:PaaI family thioesterase [Thermodesulfovibrionales bacterium]
MKIPELRDDGYCFACGDLNPRGLHLNFIKKDEKVSAVFTPLKIYQGYTDIVHGGIISTLLDEAMVKACILNGINAITAEITVRFRKPLFMGNTCIVEAWIVSRNPKLIETESVIKDREGNIIAQGKAKLIPG